MASMMVEMMVVYLVHCLVVHLDVPTVDQLGLHLELKMVDYLVVLLVY